MATETSNTVYVFGICSEFELYQAVCKNLQGVLNQNFRVEVVTKKDTATRLLKDSSTKLILAVTPGLAMSKQSLPIKEFLNSGGTLIFCGMFSSTIGPLDANKFFKKLGLPWKFGDYCRTTDHITPIAASLGGFPESYSNKATRLENVAPSDRLYTPTADSRVQSFVFAAEPVETREAAVAFGKCGGGYVGYIGDVNDEVESALVVKRLCEWALAR